ncbi:MAG: RNA pseudouridine synthase, partial [Gammaproteobacteria bacterium]
VEVEIETGRTHQIRVHAQYADHPLLGDGKYGDFELNKKLEKVGLKRIFLHAKVMEFTHPMTGENLRIEAPLSSELESFMEAL